MIGLYSSQQRQEDIMDIVSNYAPILDRDGFHAALMVSRMDAHQALIGEVVAAEAHVDRILEREGRVGSYWSRRKRRVRMIEDCFDVIGQTVPLAQEGFSLAMSWGSALVYDDREAARNSAERASVHAAADQAARESEQSYRHVPSGRMMSQGQRELAVLFGDARAHEFRSLS